MIISILTVILVAICIKFGMIKFHYHLFEFTRRFLCRFIKAIFCCLEFKCFEFKTDFSDNFRNLFEMVQNENENGTTTKADCIKIEQMTNSQDVNTTFAIQCQRLQVEDKANRKLMKSEHVSEYRSVNSILKKNTMRTTKQNSNSLIKTLKTNTIGDVFEFVSIFGENAHCMLMEKYQKYGPIYTFSALGQKMVFLFEVEDIKALMKAEGRCPVHIDFKHLRKHREDKGFPKGLLVSNGDEWRRQRKVLSSLLMFKTGQHVRIIDEIVTETVSRIASSNRMSMDGPFNVESITRDFAINAFGSVLFGSAFETTFTENGKIMKLFAEMAKDNFKDAKKLLMTPEWMMTMHPAWRRHNKRWDFLLQTIIEIIQKRTRDTCDNSILSCLLNKGKFSDKEIFINMTDLLVASIDTTNTVLQWCLYELARHPDVQKTILEEVNQVVQDNSSLEKSDLDRLVFLKAVIWETFRLHPVGFFTSRMIKNEMTLKDVTIPPKTNVAISMYVMCRNSIIFPETDSFKPTRWLSENSKLKKFPHDVFFGFGPRMCLGKKIAEMEIMTFILRFCMEFDFWTDDNTIGHTVKLLLSPSRPVEISIRRRSP